MPSTTRHNPNALACEPFRPNLPLDPVPSHRAPWSLDVDELPCLADIRAERRIIVVLGQPSAADLKPLFESKQLASSLVVVASHASLNIPTESQPAVHFLRLNRPITVEETGAARLINILEWAVLAVRNWRKPGAPKFLVYTEVLDDEPGSETVDSHHSASHIRFIVSSGINTSPEPDSSSSSRKNPVNTRKRLPSLRAPKFPITPRQFQMVNTFLTHPEQRPFDAIFHYLPSDLPEKSLLKAAILVTTLTRPYLANAPIRSPGTRFWMEADPVPKRRVRKRWSLFGSRQPSSTADSQPYQPHSSSSASDSPSSSTGDSGDTTMSMLPRQRESRIVHLMPFSLTHTKNSYAVDSQARLIRSIETFVLSFSYPVATRSMPSFDPDFVRARPYILPAKALSNYLTFVSPKASLQSSTDHGNGSTPRSKWTLADLILCGALDQPDVQTITGIDEEKMLSDVALGKQRMTDLPGSNAWLDRRAWINDIRDLRIAAKSSSECGGVRVHGNGLSHKRRSMRRRLTELDGRCNKSLPMPPEDEFEDFEKIEADSSATIGTFTLVSSRSASAHDQHKGIPCGSSSLRGTRPSISAPVPLSSHASPSPLRAHAPVAMAPVLYPSSTPKLPDAVVVDMTSMLSAQKPATPALVSIGGRSSGYLHKTPAKRGVLLTRPSSNYSSQKTSRSPNEKIGVPAIRKVGERRRSPSRRRSKEMSLKKETGRSKGKRINIGALGIALSGPISPNKSSDRMRRSLKKDGQTSLREKDNESMKRGGERKKEKLENRSRSRGYGS